MKSVVLGIFASALLFVTAANADAIADRKAVMKTKNGASIGLLAKTAKGEMEFDAAAVLNAFKTMREGTEGFADLFPEGSEMGDTTASPKIWEDMEGFKAELASFHADLDTAIAAAPQDKAAFMPLFSTIGGHCASCHEKYRLQKN